MDTENLKDKAYLLIQTLGLILLTWLSSSIDELTDDVKTLNVKMTRIVTITDIHAQLLGGLNERVNIIDKNHIVRNEFERRQDETLASEERIWDAINELRKEINSGKSKL